MDLFKIQNGIGNNVLMSFDVKCDPDLSDDDDRYDDNAPSTSNMPTTPQETGQNEIDFEYINVDDENSLESEITVTDGFNFDTQIENGNQSTKRTHEPDENAVKKRKTDHETTNGKFSRKLIFIRRHQNFFPSIITNLKGSFS